MGLAVTIATAFAAASLMLTDAARATIVRELAGTPQAVSLVVLPTPTPEGAESDDTPPPGLPSDVEQRVRDTPGVDEVAGFGSGTVGRLLPGAPGDGEAWTVVGSVDGTLARYPVVVGALPAGPQDAALSEESAERTGLGPGGVLSLVAADGTAEDFTVTGVVRVRLQALNTVLLRPEVAAGMTGAGPSQLDVLPAAGVPAADLRARLADAVGDRALVRDGDSVRADELARAFGSVDGVFAALAVFGGTAALAAALTTSCVFAVVMGRQRRTVVLLRAVGAGRGQVLRALLADAAVIGVVAGVLGTALSLGLVEVVRVAVRRGLGEELPAPGVPWALLAVCVAGAVVTTLIAAVGPAVRVSGERPASVVATEVRSRRSAPRILRFLAAGVLAGASALLVLLSTRVVDPQQSLLLVAGGGVLAFGAALAAGPVLLPALAWLLGVLVAPLSRLIGRLAVRSVLRAPQRATTTAAALVLAGLLLSVVLVGLESMSTSVTDRIAARFPAAVVTLAAGQRPLPVDLDGRIAELPESGAVAPVQAASIEVVVGEPRLDITAVDPAAFPPLLEGAVDAGSLADLVPGTVAMDREQAARWQVGVGDPVTFAVPDAPVELTVVAVYRSSGVLGAVTTHPTDLPRIVEDSASVRQVLVAPAGGVAVEPLREAVAEVVGSDRETLVTVPADLRATLDSTLALTRTVALGLVAATVLVAVCGVAIALALAVGERHRESTTLRALGLTPGQIVAALSIESALLGLAGVVVGTGLGLVFGMLAVQALREQVVLPLVTVLLGSGVLVVVATVAGTLPALRAARSRPLPAAED